MAFLSSAPIGSVTPQTRQGLVHEKAHANRVGYLSHFSIVAHYPNNSIVSLRNSL